MTRSNGISADVARSGRIHFVQDATKDPEHTPMGSDIRSFLSIPLKLGSLVIGVLSVQAYSVKRFDELSVLFAEQVALLLSQYIALIGQFREPWQEYSKSERYLLTVSLRRSAKESVRDISGQPSRKHQ